MFDEIMMARIDDGSVCTRIDSPVGPLTLMASAAGLHAVLWDHELDACGANSGRVVRDSHHPVLLRACSQLAEYFAGTRTRFELPLVPRGTSFQLQIWQLLCEIPYGQTLSYGELAALSGDRNRARAVGLANSKNPISIIIPCHRVIGRSGALTGFGGGLPRKAALLELERRVQPCTRQHVGVAQCELPHIG